MTLQLYSYWRSSSAYRVRIALNLKGLRYVQKHVNLRNGDQHDASYKAINPQGMVPTLVDGSRVLTQSTAIIEYLEETRPEPALLPSETQNRARTRSLASIVTCEIQPLNNLRVLQYLKQELGCDQDQMQRWYHRWLAEGFEAFVQARSKWSFEGPYSAGATPTVADVVLIPQVYNAERFDFDLSAYPDIQRIAAQCLRLEAFQAAAPERQSDAPRST